MIAVSRSSRIAQSVKSVPLSIQRGSNLLGLPVEGQEDDPDSSMARNSSRWRPHAGGLLADDPPAEPAISAPTSGAKRRMVSMCP
jgi:hypothetical protein